MIDFYKISEMLKKVMTILSSFGKGPNNVSYMELLGFIVLFIIRATLVGIIVFILHPKETTRTIKSLLSSV
jgi:hypothetical protein